jgi:hypothetical protein
MTMRARCLAICAALALTFTGPLPTAAAADSLPCALPSPVDSPWIGYEPINAPGGSEYSSTRVQGQQAKYESYRSAGAGYVFAFLEWTPLEPAPGVYNWDGPDADVIAAHNAGVRLVWQVDIGTWEPQSWAAPFRSNPDHAGTAIPPVDLAPARDFLTALVERYKPDGVFARQQGWGSSYGVSHYELENEPDSLISWANWSTIPQDYAAWLSLVRPAIRAADPNAVVVGPALAQVDDARPDHPNGIAGVHWLDAALTPGITEWSSDTYRAAAVHPGLGPFVDGYSFHFDDPPVETSQLLDRVAAIRAVIASHTEQSAFPAQRDAPLWFTEGGPIANSSDAQLHAAQELQKDVELLGAGLTMLTLDAGSHPNDADWDTGLVKRALRTVTCTFATAGHTQPITSGLPADVTGYQYDDGSGSPIYALWAKDGSTGAPAQVTLPVGTDSVLVTDATYTPQSRPTDAGAVTIDLPRGQYSPVVFVVPVGAADPVVPETPLTALLPLAGVTVLAAAVLRRRRVG